MGIFRTLVVGLTIMMATGAIAGADELAGLVSVKNSRLSEVLVKPGLDLSAYSSVKTQAAEFEYRDVAEQRNPQASRTGRVAYPMSESTRKEFEALVTEVFDKELPTSKHFPEVSEAGPGVLLLRGGFFDIVSFVPPDRAAREAVFLSQIGSAILYLEVRDSVSGELLVRGIDRRAVEPNRATLKVNSRPVNKQETKRVIKRWAKILVNGLDELYESGPVEP